MKYMSAMSGMCSVCYAQRLVLKSSQMMKEWASARHRVQEIKKSDVKGGEKFNREMTAVSSLHTRFPKLRFHLTAVYAITYLKHFVMRRIFCRFFALCDFAQICGNFSALLLVSSHI